MCINCTNICFAVSVLSSCKILIHPTLTSVSLRPISQSDNSHLSPTWSQNPRLTVTMYGNCVGLTFKLHRRN